MTSTPKTRLRLVPWIAPSCSLLARTVTEPDPAPVQIHAGFTPAWFARHMPLDVGERWHRDPVVRWRSMQRMAEVMNQQFPSLQPGGDPAQRVGSISQIHTCALVAALFDQNVLYRSDDWPVAQGGPLSDQQADHLQPPDLDRHHVMAELMRQMDEIERRWGRIAGDLNYQGVLNTAFRLRGQTIFLDMVEEPGRADHILSVVRHTMMELARRVRRRQTDSGHTVPHFVTGNCVVNMISRGHYARFVQPHDQALAQQWSPFGIHNCAWQVDPYLEGYQQVGNLRYLDFGVESDLGRIRRQFPGATLAPMIRPTVVHQSKPAELDVLARRLRDDLGPCHVIAADIDATTPAGQVLHFFDAFAAAYGCSPQFVVAAMPPW